ncbi:MAG: hypothetical protein SFY66_18905 [Oculatellaceae cyanobacterium bins.114]|nr:hypothetical protein [Oculatellaceae cyanobacterium bins.114]
MTIATRANPFQTIHPSRLLYPVDRSIKAFQYLWKSSYPYFCIAWIALLLFCSVLFVHLHQQFKRSPSSTQKRSRVMGKLGVGSRWF